MERRKDFFDLLLKPDWIVPCLIVVFAILFLVILPYLLIHSDSGWAKLSAISTYFYAIIMLFTFPVIAATAFFALRQLLEITKNRKLGIVFELSKIQSTKEMYQALRTVHEYSTPEEILSDPEKDFQRRMVSDFWNNMVAWAVLEGIVEPEVIRSRFEQAMKDVWVRLRPLEIAKRIEIERRDHPDWDDERIYSLAEDHVDRVLPLAKLYRIMNEEAVTDNKRPTQIQRNLTV